MSGAADELCITIHSGKDKLEALSELAEDVFADDEPLDMLFRGTTHDIVKNGEGYDVVWHLPLVEKESVNLSKKGAELSVRVGGYRRSVVLPDSMSERVSEAESMEPVHWPLTLTQLLRMPGYVYPELPLIMLLLTLACLTLPRFNLSAVDMNSMTWRAANSGPGLRSGLFRTRT